MSDCLFCKIVKGEIPAKIAFEGEKILVFHDINPQSPLHLLIIPREHLESIETLEPKNLDLSREIFKTVKILKEKFGLNGGYRLVCNSGRDSGQEVNHLHFHFLAGRRFSWPPG